AVTDVIAAYLDHLVVERALARNTLASYRRDLCRYREYLTTAGYDHIEAVTEELVTGFAVSLVEGDDVHAALARSSAARTVAGVRGLHGFAYAEGVTVENPAKRVRPPSPGERLPQALGVDEVLRLLATTGDNGPGALRDRALMELLYSTGARISVVVGLDLDDLDDSERTVVLAGKGGKQRLVPVGRPAVQALQAYRTRARPEFAKRGRGSPAVFLNAHGGRLS